MNNRHKNKKDTSNKSINESLIASEKSGISDMTPQDIKNNVLKRKKINMPTHRFNIKVIFKITFYTLILISVSIIINLTIPILSSLQNAAFSGIVTGLLITYAEKKNFRVYLKSIGFIHTDDLSYNLDFARTVGKRLDEHRESVEAIVEKTDLFKDDWHIIHFATQDDYLMRLYYMRHGVWPIDLDEEEGRRQPETGEYVRPRPEILGKCRLPEYNGK